MVAKTDFVWVDLDIVALRPFDFTSDYIFGYESFDSVGCAVLKLPKESLALKALSAFSSDTRGLPPRLTEFQRVRYFFKNILYRGLPIERWPWGSIGPSLFTAELHRSNEIQRALPLHCFYPVPMSEIPQFSDPDGYRRSDAPEGAYAVHLWGSHLSRHVAERYAGVFPADSFVNRVCNDDW